MRGVSVLTAIMSAYLPASIDPISRSRPSARSRDRRHAKHMPGIHRGGIHSQLAEKGSNLHLLEHVEVVVLLLAVGTKADRNPASSISSTGAMPLASFMLLTGLWATVTPRLEISSISEESSQTPWAIIALRRRRSQGVEREHRPLAISLLEFRQFDLRFTAMGVKAGVIFLARSIARRCPASSA